MVDVSNEAVQKLGVSSFVNVNMDSLYRRLSEALDSAQKAQDPGTQFRTMSLPIVNGLIHFASTRHQLDNAIDWVEKANVKRIADPTSTLAALTLLYIVDNGVTSEVGDQSVWRKMREYLQA
jgi:hypothetical protein